MKLAGDVPLIIITFLGTFYFTVWVNSLLLVYNTPERLYPPEWLIPAVSTLFALLTAVFVWTRSASNGGTLGCGRRLGTGVFVWYLITGAALAVSRVALLVTAMPQLSSYAVSETFQHLWWVLEPEVFLVNSTSLGSRGSTWMEILLAGGVLVTLGSVIMATPILLVGWLRHRRTTS